MKKRAQTIGCRSWGVGRRVLGVGYAEKRLNGLKHLDQLLKPLITTRYTLPPTPNTLIHDAIVTRANRLHTPDQCFVQRRRVSETKLRGNLFGLGMIDGR
jgi:hypothetical protein